MTNYFDPLPIQRIVLLISGAKGLSVLEALCNSKCSEMIDLIVTEEVPGVIDDSGRRIYQISQEKGIRLASQRDYKGKVRRKNFTIAIAAGWRWLIPDLFAERIIFHDSLLPRYRGFNPLVSALIAGDTTLGATVITADESFDEGEILLQKHFSIEYPLQIDLATKLICKTYHELAVDFSEIILAKSPISTMRQEPSEISYSLWRDEFDYFIDWGESASQISRFIDAVGPPYAGAKTYANGELITIVEGIQVDDVKIVNRVPGKLFVSQPDGPVVVCGSGLLKILKAQNIDGSNFLPLSKFRTRFGSLPKNG